MQTSVGQVDAANSAKHEVKHNEDKKKAKAASTKHSAGTYESRRHDVPSYKIAFPFVHLRVLCGYPHSAAQTKMAQAQRPAPFLYL
jgi:hypothetical protein